MVGEMKYTEIEWDQSLFCSNY